MLDFSDVTQEEMLRDRLTSAVKVRVRLLPFESWVIF